MLPVRASVFLPLLFLLYVEGLYIAPPASEHDGYEIVEIDNVHVSEISNWKCLACRLVIPVLRFAMKASLSLEEINRNQIKNLLPIKQLTSLKRLSLYKNQIDDLSELKELTSLTSLTLSRNQISDLSPINELTSLTTLLLSQNQISDISPIKKLNQLKN